MALVAFFRGINVGGHRRFRPSVLAGKLSDYDVLNVGATGTFVVRKPGSRAKFRAALLQNLPFEAEVMLCDGRDILRLELENPFQKGPSRRDTVPSVRILAKAAHIPVVIPFTVPAGGDWFVRVIAMKGQFIFGFYRRHMKTIGYLGQIDKHFGTPVTTRNWNMILAIIRVLKNQKNSGD